MLKSLALTAEMINEFQWDINQETGKQGQSPYLDGDMVQKLIDTASDNNTEFQEIHSNLKAKVEEECALKTYSQLSVEEARTVYSRRQDLIT